jgi:hypothetical protein
LLRGRTVAYEPTQLVRARDYAVQAKASELAAHLRAVDLHEQSATIQQRLGRHDRAQAARQRADHARELHAQALVEQADQDAWVASWKTAGWATAAANLSSCGTSRARP